MQAINEIVLEKDRWASNTSVLPISFNVNHTCLPSGVKKASCVFLIFFSFIVILFLVFLIIVVNILSIYHNCVLLTQYI